MVKLLPEISQLVDQVILEIGSFDLILNDQHDQSRPPSRYLLDHRHEYIRTVQDMVAHFGGKKNVRILEIGAFFGLVCICLAKLGYKMTAVDIPEYMSLPEQKARFAKYNVQISEVRLENFLLPFNSESFDAIIMCEVLEHLNFNPLPLIKEINRICAVGGLFYLALPNQTRLGNRISLIRGRSIQISVDDFFQQLDPSFPVIANGHWREYTMQDIRQMLSPLGFYIKRQYYFSLGECLPRSSLRRYLARVLYESFPALKEKQVTFAIKESRSNILFTIPKTVHPTLESI